MTEETILKKDLLCIRNAKKEDIPFIYDTWMNSYFYYNVFFDCKKQNKKSKSKFMQTCRKVIDHILTCENTKILISCLKDDDSVIMGYSVSSSDKDFNNILHYAYVKKDWRRIGLFNDLVPFSPEYITHKTKIIDEITKLKDANFQPYLL